ncbi:MAG: hypothetical protein RRA15_01330 [bacterium]|nr:hypothetical protein [bacterium]MDT8365120.1 hypothetical protein [bacterium]
MKVTCAACRVVAELPDKVGFRDTCPSCDAYLHSCVNCLHWVDSRCSEPSAERVGDPKGINFCDWYRVREKIQGTRDKEKGRDGAEELWRKLTKK